MAYGRAPIKKRWNLEPDMVGDSHEKVVGGFDCPTLVLAGPGAGKTHLLADAVRSLLDNGTDKSVITVLTFGRDAT
jgi:superfamily I DNA/RNA helicase